MERDSLTVSALAYQAADPGSNPAQGDDFFKYSLLMSASEELVGIYNRWTKVGKVN